MARFDIHRNTAASRASAPFLIDVQNNNVSGLGTRVVIPLRKIQSFSRFVDIVPNDLCPILHLAGARYFLSTAELAAMESKRLGAFITSGAMYQNEILAALDRLFGSY
jgi:hypothetical protein